MICSNGFSNSYGENTRLHWRWRDLRIKGVLGGVNKEGGILFTVIDSVAYCLIFLG